MLTWINEFHPFSYNNDVKIFVFLYWKSFLIDTCFFGSFLNFQFKRKNIRKTIKFQTPITASTFDLPSQSAMEFHLQQTDLWTSMEEQTKSIDLPQNTAVLPDPIHFPNSPSRPSVPAPWAMSPAPPPSTNHQHFIYHCIASLHRPDGNILSIAMTKEFIFVGSESGRIESWKLPECTGVGFIKARSGEVGAMFGSGRMGFSCHGDYRVRIWEVKMGNKRLKAKKISTLPSKRSFLVVRKSSRRLQYHTDCISCLAYNDADKLLYTGNYISLVYPVFDNYFNFFVLVFLFLPLNF